MSHRMKVRTMKSYLILPLLLALAIPSTSHAYEWRCSVFLRWQVDDRSGTSTQSIPVDDATGMSDAEGKALYRAQTAVRRLFSDRMGRRVTFPASNVVCR